MSNTITNQFLFFLTLLILKSDPTAGSGSTIVQIKNNKYSNFESRIQVKRDIATLPLRDIRTNYFRKLSENNYKYKTEKEKQFFSKGWGAGGMPFNVLYTPNKQQQKILKSNKKILESLMRNEVTTNKSLKLPEVLNFVLDERKSVEKISGKTYKKPLSRKYFSYIPQMFVSYGW